MQVIIYHSLPLIGHKMMEGGRTLTNKQPCSPENPKRIFRVTKSEQTNRRIPEGMSHSNNGQIKPSEKEKQLAQSGPDQTLVHSEVHTKGVSPEYG